MTQGSMVTPPAVGSENGMSMISVYTGNKCCIVMLRYQPLHTGIPVQAYTKTHVKSIWNAATNASNLTNLVLWKYNKRIRKKR